MSLHPLTLASIEAERVIPTTGILSSYECGCGPKADEVSSIWTLCPYHQGFQDALTLVYDHLSENIAALVRNVGAPPL